MAQLQKFSQFSKPLLKVYPLMLYSSAGNEVKLYELREREGKTTNITTLSPRSTNPTRHPSFKLLYLSKNKAN